jgi:hypothetical protein
MTTPSAHDDRPCDLPGSDTVNLTTRLNGSNSQASDVRGIVYNPLGEVQVNGANSTFTMDQVIAYTFKINGSGGTVKVLRRDWRGRPDHRHRSRRVAIRSGSRGSGARAA